MKNRNGFQKGYIPWNKGKLGLQTSNKKGRTWEDIYGEERAKEIKEKSCISHTGKVQPKEIIEKRIAPLMGRKRPPYSEDWRAKIGDGQRGRKQTIEQRRKESKSAKENFKDPEFCKEFWKRFRVKPNKPETLILNILDKLFPGEWKYTGNYSFWINGKNPDFTCINGKKLLIEHFGTYWHRGKDPEERKKIFSKFGYSTLVIWEEELKNMKEIENKIRKFIEVRKEK